MNDLAIIRADEYPVLDSPHAIKVTWEDIARKGMIWLEFSQTTLKAPIHFALGEYLSDRLGVVVRGPFVVFASDGDMIYFKMWEHDQVYGEY